MDDGDAAGKKPADPATFKSQVESWLFSDFESDLSINVNVLRNALSLHISGTLRQRSNRIQSSASEHLRAVILSNLRQPKSVDGPDEPTGSAVPLKPIPLPDSKSTYATRISYLIAGINQQRILDPADIDKIAQWEYDLAASDAARFEEKVIAMATGIAVALIGRTVDSRAAMVKTQALGLSDAIALGAVTPLRVVVGPNEGDYTLEPRESIFASLLERSPPDLISGDAVALRKQQVAALLASDDAFTLSRQKEREFVDSVVKMVMHDYTKKNTRTLLLLRDYLPREGMEYVIHEVENLGGIPTEAGFGIGNGVSFVLECAEIARNYLESLSVSTNNRKTYSKRRGPTAYKTADGKELVQVINGNNAIFEQNTTTKNYLTETGVLPKETIAEEEDDLDEIFYVSKHKITPKEVADYITQNFKGYCYQRQWTTDRPVFARLVSLTGAASAEITKLDNAATLAGCMDLAGPDPDAAADDAVPNNFATAVERGKYHYYRAIRAATGGDQTGRRIGHLGGYFVVSLCPVAAFSARSYMQYGEWWGPNLEHAAVEGEACVQLESMARLMAETRKRPRTETGGRDQPLLIEKISEAGCSSFEDLFIIDNDSKAKQLASRLLRLVQTIQACNELYRDAGTRNRTSVAREDLFEARRVATAAVLTFK